MKPVQVGRELRNMGHMPRWAIIQKVKQQSVAEHCYFVTLYADRFMDYIDAKDYEFKYKVLVACQHHDLEELTTGDIAGPSKKYMFNKETKDNFAKWQLSQLVDRFPWYTEETDPKVLQVMIIADYLEGAAFLAENMKLGCDDAMDVYEVYISKLVKLGDASDEILGLKSGTTEYFCASVLREILGGKYKVVI